jgi:hypothetical protein
VAPVTKFHDKVTVEDVVAVTVGVGGWGSVIVCGSVALDSVEFRFDNVEFTIDSGVFASVEFDSVEFRLDNVEFTVDNVELKVVNGELNDVEFRFDIVEFTVDNVELTVDSVEFDNVVF